MLEHLVVALWHGAGNNQRRAGVVNKHRVNLIDNGVVVGALHKVFRAYRHVVAKVVEAELVVCAESDVRLISLATCRAVGLVLVDAVNAKTVEHIHRSHPFRVALCKVVVHGNDVNAVAGEGVEEHGKRCHKRLSLAGCHFGYFALVEHNSAEQLHVVMHHVPRNLISAGNPMVLVYCLVAVDAHEVVCGGKLAVKVCGGYGYFLVLCEAACCFAHNGESVGQYLIELFVVAFQHFLFKLVDLAENGFAVLDGGFLNLAFEFDNLFLYVIGGTLDDAFQFLRLCTQRIVVERLYCRFRLLYFLNPRLDFLHVAGGFVSEYFA